MSDLIVIPAHGDSDRLCIPGAVAGEGRGVLGVSTHGVQMKSDRLASFDFHLLSLASGRIFNHFDMFPPPKGEQAGTSLAVDLKWGCTDRSCVRFQGPLY